MRVTISQSAPEHTVFEVGAFAGSVGKEVPFRAPGYTGRATVVDTEVVDQGRAVNITFEIADRSEIAHHLRIGSFMSAHFDGFAFRAATWPPATPAGNPTQRNHDPSTD